MIKHNMQIDETMLELQFFKAEEGFYKSLIDLSTENKTMQIEYDNAEEHINSMTNSLIWENKQVNKEYLALMRLNFSNLKDTTSVFAQKMEELENLNKQLQEEVEVIDNKLTFIKTSELPSAQNVVLSPDNERQKLKKSKESLTKTYYDLSNKIKIAKENKMNIKDKLEEVYKLNTKFMT